MVPKALCDVSGCKGVSSCLSSIGPIDVKIFVKHDGVPNLQTNIVKFYLFINARCVYQ